MIYNRNRNLLVLLLSLAISPLSVNAETLREAVSIAVDTHPLIGGSKAAFRAAERAVNEQQSGFYPSIDFTADTGRQNAKRVSSTSAAQNAWRKKYRLSAIQMLYDGFQTSNLVKEAESRKQAAQFNSDSSVNEITSRAIQAYLNVSKDRDLILLSKENIELHRNILSEVEESVKLGGTATSNAAQVRTRLSFALAQMRSLEGSLLNSTADYLEVVGQAPGNTRRPQFPVSSLPGTLEEAILLPLKNNPDISSVNRNAQAQSHLTKAERGAFYPIVEFELAHEGRDNVDATAGFQSDSTAIVNLTWNLFAGGGNTASHKKAIAEESRARLRVLEVERLVREEMTVNFNNYEVARDRLGLLKDRLVNAEQVTAAYNEQFRLGQRTILDLLDSGNELFVAKVDLVTTEYEIIQASFDILTTAGTVYSTLQSQP